MALLGGDLLRLHRESPQGAKVRSTLQGVYFALHGRANTLLRWGESEPLRRESSTFHATDAMAEAKTNAPSFKVQAEEGGNPRKGSINRYPEEMQQCIHGVPVCAHRPFSPHRA